VHIQEEAQPKIAQVLGLSNADTVLDVSHDDHGNIRHGNIRRGNICRGNICRGKIRRGNISHGICMSRVGGGGSPALDGAITLPAGSDAAAVLRAQQLLIAISGRPLTRALERREDHPALDEIDPGKL
tara:strand:- start:468 stop:851 length:384 start_codon:yes stop_codon:yes gene_type:complete